MNTTGGPIYVDLSTAMDTLDLETVKVFTSPFYWVLLCQFWLPDLNPDSHVYPRLSYHSLWSNLFSTMILFLLTQWISYPIFNIKCSTANSNGDDKIQRALPSWTSGTWAPQSCSECRAGFIPPCTASIPGQTTDFASIHERWSPMSWEILVRIASGVAVVRSWRVAWSAQAKRVVVSCKVIWLTDWPCREFSPVDGSC